MNQSSDLQGDSEQPSFETNQTLTGQNGLYPGYPQQQAVPQHFFYQQQQMMHAQPQFQQPAYGTPGGMPIDGTFPEGGMMPPPQHFGYAQPGMMVHPWMPTGMPGAIPPGMHAPPQYYSMPQGQVYQPNPMGPNPHSSQGFLPDSSPSPHKTTSFNDGSEASSRSKNGGGQEPFQGASCSRGSAQQGKNQSSGASHRHPKKNYQSINDMQDFKQSKSMKQSFRNPIEKKGKKQPNKSEAQAKGLHSISESSGSSKISRSSQMVLKTTPLSQLMKPQGNLKKQAEPKRDQNEEVDKEIDLNLFKPVGQLQQLKTHQELLQKKHAARQEKQSEQIDKNQEANLELLERENDMRTQILAKSKLAISSESSQFYPSQPLLPSGMQAPGSLQTPYLPNSHLPYTASYYQGLVENLYYENGDGEISIYVSKFNLSVLVMVTAIDISTLFQEKRGRALELIDKLSKIKHPNLIEISHWWYIPDHVIYVESEAPLNTPRNLAREKSNRDLFDQLVKQQRILAQNNIFNSDPLKNWKSFCKKKMSDQEILRTLFQLAGGLNQLHMSGIIHRDVHPSRFQLFAQNSMSGLGNQMQHEYSEVVKFNSVGMPFNFKKLLKRENFSGHVNYSAPELILEKMDFSEKVDVWSFGCCLYYLITKKDPFEGRSPQETKNNILTLQFDRFMGVFKFSGSRISQPIIRQIFLGCLEFNDFNRLSFGGVLQVIASYVNSKALEQIKLITPIISQNQQSFVQQPQLPKVAPVNQSLQEKFAAMIVGSHGSQQQRAFVVSERKDTEPIPAPPKTQVADKESEVILKDTVDPMKMKKDEKQLKLLKTDLIDKKGSLLFKEEYKPKQAIKEEVTQKVKKIFLKEEQLVEVPEINEAKAQEIFEELGQMPQKLNDDESTEKAQPININEQGEQLNEIAKNHIFTEPEIEIIQKTEFAPELCPVIKNPTEIQDLRKIEEADTKDIQEWIDTAIDVLPEIAKANPIDKPIRPEEVKKDKIGTENSSNGLQKRHGHSSLFSNDSFIFDSSKQEAPMNPQQHTVALAPADSALFIQQESFNKTNFQPFLGTSFQPAKPSVSALEDPKVPHAVEISKSKSNEAQNKSSIFSLGLKLSARQSSKRLNPNPQIEEDPNEDDLEKKDIKKLILPNGSCYEGELNGQGEFDGMGKFTDTENNVFEGFWVNGIINGICKIEYASGDIYEGEVKEMKKDGIGTLYFVNSNERYEGQWTKGEMTGFGKYFFYSEDEKSYTGQFLKGQMFGNGTIKSKNYIFRGMVKNGQFDGFGRFEDLKTEVTYEGNFKKGKREGFGKEINGEKHHVMSVYEGFWRKDKRHGEGKLTRQKSASSPVEFYEGMWKEDKLAQISQQMQGSTEQVKKFQTQRTFAKVLEKMKQQKESWHYSIQTNTQEEGKLMDYYASIGLKKGPYY